MSEPRREGEAVLSFSATDVSGERVILPSPLSVTMRMEEDVPADDLYAVFPDTDCPELREITVIDGGRTAFIGVVDEEEHIFAPEGTYLRISARSQAALLLDNEAVPCSYDHPGAKRIYERYVSDFGIAAGDLDDATCFGELTVDKGSSVWSVIRNFCAACYSTVPRVSADGVLYMKGMKPRGTTVFGDGGLRFTELSERRKRCEEISRVNVKISADGGYSYPVENTDAVSRGVRRERCLNALMTGTPIKCADVILQKGMEKSYLLTLKCPGRLLDIFGNNAVLRSGLIGGRDGLYVSAVSYRMDSKGEFTAVTLKRRYDLCGYQDM